jgi:hypothetical protein
MTRCLRCNAKMDSDERFCPECGYCAPPQLTGRKLGELLRQLDRGEVVAECGDASRFSWQMYAVKTEFEFAGHRVVIFTGSKSLNQARSDSSLDRQSGDFDDWGDDVQPAELLSEQEAQRVNAILKEKIADCQFGMPQHLVVIDICTPAGTLLETLPFRIDDPFVPPELTHAQSKAIDDELLAQNLVAALKLYREFTGASLPNAMAVLVSRKAALLGA